jgi:malonyl-CoA O-methyltransferase
MDGWLDRRAARRWFERATPTAGADALAREVERRMAERLAYVRHDPVRILNAGCGAAGCAVLRNRYPAAEVLAVDSALGLLRRSRDARPLTERARALLRGSRERIVCADLTALPLQPGACGMIWSNLALAWSADLAATIREWHRVLSVGGLLMFSTYGPDTLKELRAAPFCVRIALAGRALTGPRRWARAGATYAALARDGRVPATFEIVYGHAWKAAPRVAADGRAIIRIDRNRAPRKPA